MTIQISKNDAIKSKKTNAEYSLTGYESSKEKNKYQ